jgi:hypothetical protein
MTLPITLENVLRQKKNDKNSNISPCKNTPNFQKPSNRNLIPSRYYNSITNLKFPTQSKISSFKNPHIKIDLVPRGENPLS